MMSQRKTRKKILFRSIRNKLFLLGIVAIAATIILGVTGIDMINRNNVNNQVLADINNINLHQNENYTKEVSFLYNLDNSDNQAILENLKSMEAAAQDALGHSELGFNAELNSIKNNITKNTQNMSTLVSLFEKRSFKDIDGMYAKFISEDANFADSFSMMDNESEWIDGAWSDVSLNSLEIVEIDGKNYRHLTYQSEMSAQGKRDYIIARIGNNAIEYTGNVIITNIKLDGATEVNLSELQEGDLSKSYGSGFNGLKATSFNGNSALGFLGTYSGDNEDWQEASIQIPIADYDIQDYSKISFDIYFEDTQMPLIKVAVAFNGKYAFAENLEKLNHLFQQYSKSVAEGKDATDLVGSLESLFAELEKNVAIYSKNDEAVNMAVNACKGKREIFNEILTLDQEILSLKSENNQLNDLMSEETASLRQLIEDETNNAKTRMITLILSVFIVSVFLIVLLTGFVSFSVQKSIKGFQATLGTISEGNMAAKATVGTGDEFDGFGQSLNQMTGRLTDTLQSVVSVAADLKNSGGNLENAAQLTSKTSSQIEMSITDISNGATEQANDVEQSMQQMFNLGELMEEMVSNVNELDDTSINMKKASLEAEQILGALGNSNNRMTEGIVEIANQISTTNNSVQEIKEAVSLISSIASQTNLLSLNASIEAARAGEAGRGFAVVASEIQKLAEQSNHSAETIYQVITNLTDEFQQTVKVMDEVKTATAEQNKRLNETQQQFGIVGEGISASRDKTSIIKESIDQCYKVRVEINQFMLNLSAISEENAASTQETAESMQVLNTTIQELLQASEKLNEISISLENDMKFFTF